MDTVKPGPRHTRAFLRDVIETAIIAIVIFVLARALVLNFEVDGSSMEPTLHHGERVLVNPNAYSTFDLGDLVDWLPFVPDQHWLTIVDWGEPERGDVVVLTPLPPGEQEAHIKRVIGIPGDHITIVDNTVYVNGETLDESTTGGAATICRGSGTYAQCDVTVPDDHIFVLGDHRDNSVDSRYFGVVPIDRIIGRAWLVYWPLQNFGIIP